jgi:hypothetical protein
MNSSKIFPIKVERVTPQYYKIVEWMLHNVCNYKCSFCSDNFKDGSRRWLDIEVYKNTCKKIMTESKTPIWFKFTGGEPTLFSKLPELLSYVKQNGSFTYIISNGARTLRYWEEVRDSNTLDFLALSFHPEQTDNINHIVDVINLFKDTETMVTTNVTCIPEYFDKAVEAHNTILNSCAVISTLQQINQQMERYSPEQNEVLQSNSLVKSPTFKSKRKPSLPELYQYHDSKIRYTFNDGSERIDYGIQFVKEKLNVFTGWECDVGKEMIRIDYETITRAVCGRGDKWSIYSDKMFADKHIICDTSIPCSCVLDIIETKRR